MGNDFIIVRERFVLQQNRNRAHFNSYFKTVKISLLNYTELQIVRLNDRMSENEWICQAT